MLAVPHFQQELSYTCLPACARMLLAYHGKAYSEQELAAAFGILPLVGTAPHKMVDGLKEMGYQALWFENATAERLLDLYENGWPVIIFLNAADLPHGTAGLHALVLVEIDSKYASFLDPMLKNPLVLPLPEFLNAWAKLKRQGASFGYNTNWVDKVRESTLLSLIKSCTKIVSLSRA